ncbi:MAG: AAA family ATPase [Gammaproteobacteria bacterium]|nr:AAA family ATPase [Gammaproteobacteria bacterium]
MYEKYFSLTTRPFDLTPDPRFMFMTPQHARAVASIRFALMNRDSFVIITGEIGIGKTTILNAVLEDLGPDYVTAKLTHTTLSRIELLQALLSEFDMPNYTKKKVLLLDTLRDYFLEQHEQGKHVVVIVDEAQNLDEAALEELRLLSCIDNRDRRIVSIILTGQCGLDELIDAPSLRQLRQRARLRQRLEPLTEQETADYIEYRLKVAGGSAAKIFSQDAISEIHRLCFGIPRLINTLCDTAMMTCFVDEEDSVTLEIVDQAAHQLRWQWLEERDEEDAAREQQLAPAHSDDDAPVALDVYRDGSVIQQARTSKFPLVIGRSNANDLVIIDKAVSRRHALIDRIGGIYVVEDLNSTNGILVNRKRCSRAFLRPGDVISFGRMDVVFQPDASSDGDRLPEGEAGHVATVVIDEVPGNDSDSDEPGLGEQKQSA